MMKKLGIVAPAILSLLTIVIASKANAVPEINSIPEGFEVTTGNCYVHFNPSGKMIYVAEKCNDRQVNEAKKAAQSYVKEQSGSGSEHMNNGASGTPPTINTRSDGKFDVNMPSGCVVLFSNTGGLIQKGSSCSGSDVNKAKDAINSYLREQGGSGSEHMNGGYRGEGGASGSDFFEVTGVANNDLGALQQPALGSTFIVRHIRNGTVLRNLGCSKHGGESWCQVELRDNPTWQGWVRQVWLREF
jgi:hypothetical protein